MRTIVMSVSALSVLLTVATAAGCRSGYEATSDVGGDIDSDALDGGGDGTVGAGCGDGVITAGEACDDMNAVEGDGCTRCQLDPGWVCSGAPSSCRPLCGDGIRTGGEACDDGGVLAGDGCSPTCEVEAGWSCDDAELTSCVSTCGDGVTVGDEGCDDMNDVAGDGCTACEVDDGWTCEGGGPGSCQPTCGDGAILGAEECDDGDTSPDDGCGPDCKVEAGWSCDDEPSVCQNSCGDGVIDDGETCDDDNATPGDGCGAGCQTEKGWSCDGQPSKCATSCGDGITAGQEECDIGDVSSPDGAAGCVDCKLVDGWDCDTAAEPSVCAPVCGDGKVLFGEACDDGDTDDGDGCSSQCTPEKGWTCDESSAPTKCTPVCGDGVVVQGEGCDDGETVSGDGCSHDCQVEEGWVCASAPSMCAAVCGDGVVVGSEGCDDGAKDPGDGCSPFCGVEPGWSCATPADGGPSQCTKSCTDPDGDGYGEGTSCKGPDCAEGDASVHPGATETCNGVDDDCNGATDEGTDAPCYDGDPSSVGTGACTQGTSYCIGGELQACTGQVLPTAEVCNGVDDDCDGTTDEDTGTLVCGSGTCVSQVDGCSNGGVTAACPVVGGAEECNGVDDDCDGEIDEGCGCIYVSKAAVVGGNGSSTLPFKSIQAGIDAAAASVASGDDVVTRVCVAAQAGCSLAQMAPVAYQETITMKDGVSVFGGYDPTTWTRKITQCGTAIQSASPAVVTFGPGVLSPTQLDGVAVVSTGGGEQAVGIRINGAGGAVVSNSAVLGSGASVTSVGVEVTGGAGLGDADEGVPSLAGVRVQAGDASATGIGVRVVGARAFIRSCSPYRIDNATKRCTGGNGEDMFISGFTSNPAGTTFGILLEDAPGTVIDQTAVHTHAELKATAIGVSGDATGVQISRSYAEGWGAANENVGIALGDCEGTAAWIGDNHAIYGGGDPNANATSIGIGAAGGCPAVIEGNALIAAGIEGKSSLAVGVACDAGEQLNDPSACVIAGNEEIRGSTATAPPTSWGVHCGPGSCERVSDNALIDGNNGANVAALHLQGDGTRIVDGNHLVGGCGKNASAGILAEGASARIQNNLIEGGDCGLYTTTVFHGMLVEHSGSGAELDVHSNTIDGMGFAIGCTSYGIALTVGDPGDLPTGPLGTYRNNLVNAGLCVSHTTMAELVSQADPRVLDSNSLAAAGVVSLGVAIYRDEGSSDLDQIDAVNAMSDVSASGNISSGCGANAQGQIGALSACRDAGTTKGAPSWDLFGTPRPQGDGYDIGCHEVVQ